MNFDFPSNPVLEQEYRQNGVTYVWNGQFWARKADYITQVQTAAFSKQEKVT